MAARNELELAVEEAGGALDPLTATPPDLTLDEAADLAERLYRVAGTPSRLDSERDQNFRVDAGGGSFVLKVYNAAESHAVVEMQTRAMFHVAEVDPDLPVPRIEPTRDGTLYGVLERGGRRHAVHLIEFLAGTDAQPDEFDFEALNEFGAVVARVGRALRSFFHPAAERSLLWDVKHAARLRPLLEEVVDPARARVAERVLDRFEEHVLPEIPKLRAQVIHNDLTYDNVLVDSDRRPVAILDFGDVTHSPLIFDLAVSLAAFRGEDLFGRAEAFLRGYGEVTRLEDLEASLLADAVSTRLAASVLISAWRVRRFPENAEYITAFDAPTWPVLETLDELGPVEVRRRFRAAAAPAVDRRPTVPTRSGQATADLVERRRRAFGAAMEPLSYDLPLHVVRAEGVWMFDSEGRRYLDAYNNVPAVGHAHPRVVEALAAQARILNTNTRYLHETALELAERLAATLPDGLDTCLFVNSGSEANELAWRFATALTGGSGAVVSASAYHGVTSVATDLSPSEWTPGEEPSYVVTVPPPDGYRGRHRREQPGWGLRYAAHVQEAASALEERGRPLAAMFLESAWTSDGVFTDAPDYGPEAVRHVRERHGLFVADEVQAGFGRLGTHMWSFEASGIEPDLVTFGKPMGNGHPVAALVTRAEIAEEFARRRTPFFSTFGGNPVACAAALAVLDVIEEEQLLAQVVDVGAYLRAGLCELAGRHSLVGDVRGAGLLLGVDLVGDRETREPAGEAARAVLNGMRERGVLVGRTGPGRNVLKIRPPLAFRREHADRLVETLDVVLAGI